MKKEQKTVMSEIKSLQELFVRKYVVDFYQRDYVWEKKQLEDLINDLSNAFLKSYRDDHILEHVKQYDPYFMGEIVLSETGGKSAVIDGQQRITTLTLLLIYLLHTYKHVPKFPQTSVENSIYSLDYGKEMFNLEIEIRKNCMIGLFKNGHYEPKEDAFYVQKIVDRYADIPECWNENINEQNIVSFTYWLLGNVVFSKVSSNSDEFAYIIFETMNDRGLSLTPVEMLRSYLLANINESERDVALDKFDKTIIKLSSIKLTSKSKAESEFFKVYFRSHFAIDMTQGNDKSDFVRIGNTFHRWVRENYKLLKLKTSSDFVNFIDKIEYFAEQYELIYRLIAERNTLKHFYLIVNADYGFTLQPALIIGAINYLDSEDVVLTKIETISKYLTKVLTWRVWNHWMISQSSMEAPIYDLAKQIRNTSIEELEKVLSEEPIKLPELEGSPTLNQQNRRRLRVMLSLITEIVARESEEPNYILNTENIEVEHIFANDYDRHQEEFATQEEFSNIRNSIGGLLLLPKSFNASYNDSPYEVKVEQYYSQNILA